MSEGAGIQADLQPNSFITSFQYTAQPKFNILILRKKLWKDDYNKHLTDLPYLMHMQKNFIKQFIMIRIQMILVLKHV